jgi:actin-binding protein IPP
MGCLVLDDYLYVVGGTNRHNEVLQSVERYHFKEDRWQEIPPMLEPRASPSVAAVNGKIYVFGGDQINEVNFYRARTTIAAAECFDPLSNSWTPSDSLPESRSESGSVVI